MILLSGSAGYVGSYINVQLFNPGHEVVVFGNVSTSHLEA